MARKSAHASAALVEEQAEQARNIKDGELNPELKVIIERIENRDISRKKINDDNGSDIKMIKERFGIPAKTSRQILVERKMSKEHYCQHVHSLIEMRKMLAMDNELALVQDTAADENPDSDDNDPVKNAAKLASVA